MSKEIGIILKEARLGKKLSIDDVVNSLKIRKFYLEAIEEGDFSDLPGLTYTIGFIKSYARLVGIDFEPLMDMLKEEGAEDKEAAPVGLASSGLERPLPSRKILLSSLLILILLYVVWSFSFQEEVSDKSLETSRAPVVIDKLQIEEETDKVVSKEIVHQEVVKVEKVEKEALDKEKVSKLEVSQEPAKEVEVKRNRSYGNSNKEGSKIEIKAVEDSWIQIRDGERVLFSKVLLAGDAYYILDYSDDMVLDTGNAGGLLIIAEGEELSAIGGHGRIVRNFELNEDNLEDYQD